MPTRLSRRTVSLLAAFGALSFGPLLSGCGGGGSSSAVLPAATQFTASVPLASGQTGALFLSVRNHAATGTLVVPARTAAARPQATTLSFTVPSGTYTLTGEAVPPDGFSVRGAFPAPLGAFTLTGTVPTQTTPGSFTLIINGETITGVIPALDTLTTTPVTPPITTPVTPPVTTPSAGLTISGSTANAPEAQNGAINGPVSASKETGAFTLGGVPYDGQYNVEVSPTGGILSVEIFGTNVSAGQTFQATDPRFHSDFLATATGRYDCDGGQVTVVAISAQSITLTLTNVHYTASSGSTKASGGFTVNGTVTGAISS